MSKLRIALGDAKKLSLFFQNTITVLISRPLGKLLYKISDENRQKQTKKMGGGGGGTGR